MKPREAALPPEATSPEAAGAALSSTPPERASPLAVAFRSYLDDYYADLSELCYADLRSAQRGLFASLAFGAAGIAYALWYGALRLDDPDLARQAWRWIRSAERARRNPLAFLAGATAAGSTLPTGAVLYGAAGIPFARALICRTLGRRSEETRALDRLATLAVSTGDASDLFTGTAGGLAAAAILWDHLGDARAGRLGAELSARLIHKVVLDRDGRPSWPGAAGPALAHGAGGPSYALLLWSRAADRPPPPWLRPAIAILLTDALAEPDTLTPRLAERAWLCRGFSGVALLAIQAHRAFGGDPDFLAAARAALGLALAHPSGQADLCCGRLGAAAVALALAREDPAGGWRAVAEPLIASSLLLEREEWELVGLYGGEAALPCVALDALLAGGAGPPALSLLSDF